MNKFTFQYKTIFDAHQELSDGIGKTYLLRNGDKAKILAVGKCETIGLSTTTDNKKGPVYGPEGTMNMSRYIGSVKMFGFLVTLEVKHESGVSEQWLEKILVPYAKRFELSTVECEYERSLINKNK